VRPEAEDKIELISTSLKPATVEYRFAMINPQSMNVSISDLKIIKCLLSNARMEIADIANEASVSPRTATRRIKKMRAKSDDRFSHYSRHVFYEFNWLYRISINGSCEQISLQTNH